MLILVTGASGKTGQAVVRALTQAGAATRALVHRQEQVVPLRELGATEVVVGDLRDDQSLMEAMQGIDAIYHICPPVQPDEAAIGQRMITLAGDAHVSRFVYHSVLHPQIAAMPHHAQKLRVETALIQSNLPFTILQPAAFMQNLREMWSRIVEQGIFTSFFGLHTGMSLVDLDDVADVAVRVLTEDSHRYATYELSGPAVLTAAGIADTLGQAFGRPVTAESLDIEKWAPRMRDHGMPDHSVQTLATMFRYYEQHGLTGNPHVLTMLLKRPPTDVAGFIARMLAQ